MTKELTKEQLKELGVIFVYWTPERGWLMRRRVWGPRIKVRTLDNCKIKDFKAKVCTTKHKYGENTKYLTFNFTVNKVGYSITAARAAYVMNIGPVPEGQVIGIRGNSLKFTIVDLYLSDLKDINSKKNRNNLYTAGRINNKYEN